ncbi:hypothetical protein BMF94_1223 [Rhodotorula taiwanensis]|uniref:Kinetochore protein NDC80 n=1 Tax=Rhodotorula taiwanensis TaxID=741276 RepID=A0A2S5BFR4_9BASI|nr:hypothetical protein BMF94_1223 [Rhodotorula taiwanensis]
MADRRRTTMTTHSVGGAGGVPSSIPRPPNTLRHSLAPNAGRASMAPGAGGAASAFGRASGRASMAPGAFADSQNSQSAGPPGASQGSQFSQGHGGPPHLVAPMTASRAANVYTSFGASQSAIKSQSVLRTSMAPDYAPASERRGSTFRRSTMANSVMATPGGHMGIGASSRANAVKDPRDARPRVVRERMAQEIVDFCELRQHSVALRELLQPTGNQFYNIFEYLVKQYAGISFGDMLGNKAKKEDECLAILRACQYPFADSISKSHLQAVGSAQSWPNMLAMLHWFVEMMNSRNAAFDSYPEIHMPAPGYQDRLLDGELAPEVVISHAWMDHLARVYARFLNGEGEQLEPGNEDSPTMFAAEEDELRDTIEASSGAQRQRLEAIRAEHANLLGQWEKLESKPDPVHAYTEHCSRVKRDVEKAHVYIEKTKATIAAIAQQKADFEEDIQRALRDREEKRDQQAQAERVVRGQKLTPLEIQSLSSERAALTRQMQDVQQRYRTAVSRTMNLEIDLNKRIDEATALCARYEEKAQPLGLLNGPLEGYEDIPFAQEINGASDNPVPEGLGTEVKPALSKLRQKTRDEIRDVNMTDFRIESELTKLKEILADLREKETVEVQELDVVDHEKGQMQEAMDRELATTGAELERLQNQVLAVQATMNDALAAANHRYEQRVVERMAAYEQTSALRRKNRDALEQAIEQFMGYKEHMTDGTDRLATLLDEVAATV